MKIVIDIPEYIIEHLKDGSFGARPDDRYTLVTAVMNGTPLPRTHGRLIDADAVKKLMIPLEFSVQKWISEVDLDIYIPTIIEAESEVEE